MWKLLTYSFQNARFLFFGSQNICLIPAFLYHSHLPQHSPKNTENSTIISCMFSLCFRIHHSKPKTWEPWCIGLCSQGNTAEITLFHICHITPKNVSHRHPNTYCISLRSHWLTCKNFRKLVPSYLSKLFPLFVNSHFQLN